MSEGTSQEVTNTVAAREFSDLLARVRLNGERFAITRFGKRAAALVPMADYEQLEQPGRAGARQTTKVDPSSVPAESGAQWGAEAAQDAITQAAATEPKA